MEWQAAAATLAAIVGQFLKSLKNLPTWVPQVLMLIVGFTVFVAYNPPHTADGWGLVRYLIGAVISGASVNGVASLLGLAPALKTDSR